MIEMSNRDMPMMPLFPADFFMTTRLWSFSETAMYILLLMWEWELGKLPNDLKQLGDLLHLSAQDVEHPWNNRVRQKFHENEDGSLNNIRLGEHRAKAIKLRDAKRRGAEKTNLVKQMRLIPDGPTRIQPVPRSVTLSDTLSEVSGMVTLSATPPSPSPSPSKELREEKIHTAANAAPRKGPLKRRPVKYDPRFLEFKAAYPEREGDYRWERARQAINSCLRDGHTWDEIIDGAKRYAIYCEAKGWVGTAYVMQAATFVGTDRSFELPWTPPRKKEAPLKPGSYDEWLAHARARAEFNK